ncbi:MAG TPA: hypothetical protein VFJ84_02835 [Candidatus Saccharimonadales bacterium]|nr:hypothetical protein [Candidatus Saccharimonadales bacterium]
MKDKFRIVVPELASIPGGAISDTSITTRVETVLWKGDDMPEGAVYDALLEGQIYTRSRLSLPAPGEAVYTPIGNELLLQKRRRVALLGWKTINSVFIQ